MKIGSSVLCYLQAKICRIFSVQVILSSSCTLQLLCYWQSLL